MIRLELSTAITLYLFCSVVIILVLWILFEYRRGGKKYFSGNKHIWHCNICDNTYVDSKREELSRCPRCGSYIERHGDAEACEGDKSNARKPVK